MNLRTIATAAETITNLTPPVTGPEKTEAETKKAFTDFVGQTLFGSMLASMRKSVGKPAYMHGGRTEEVFQKQLDQKIVEQLTDASAQEIADPMYELFNMQRR
jgi:flagellar protein FlgJ